MTLDTLLRTQLRSAVDDTTVPPGLAHTALAGGRSRRRRRNLGGLALVTAAVVGGVLLLPHTGPRAVDGQVSDAGAGSTAAFRWAGTLPEGADPALPYFADGSLRSGDESVTLPSSVNASVGPWTVDGGWIVMLGKRERGFAWALLSPDGGLRSLPAETYEDGLGMARMDVSPDGRQVATGKWLVDLVAMTATELPHAPQADEADGYVTEVRPWSFTDQGLVYEGAPYTDGFGTAYLLRPDGSTVPVALPRDAHVLDNSPGDVAVTNDYAADSSDTCITAYRLLDAQWAQDGSGCLGKSLGEALSISPDGRWLITDDLPRVWDLQAGEFTAIDIPREVVTSQGDALVGGIVWETEDTFLLPVSDRSVEQDAAGQGFDQVVRVVRCTMSSGVCELAGQVENRVVLDGMSNTAFRFATS